MAGATAGSAAKLLYPAIFGADITLASLLPGALVAFSVKKVCEAPFKRKECLRQANELHYIIKNNELLAEKDKASLISETRMLIELIEHKTGDNQKYRQILGEIFDEYRKLCKGDRSVDKEGNESRGTN